MNNFPMTLLLLGLFLGTACAETKPVDIKIENVKTESAPANNLKTNSIVIDFKDFPNDVAGKEVWTKKVKTGKADVTVIKDSGLNINVLNLKSDEADSGEQVEALRAKALETVHASLSEWIKDVQVADLLFTKCVTE